MSKFDKKTIATVLAFAALLGNKTSKTQGMGIGAKVATGAAVLVGAYAIANEVLGDIGLVNHPAMGRFTAKKTIGYFMRDVEKQKALIDKIIKFIDKLSKFELNAGSLLLWPQQLMRAQSIVVEKNKQLIPSIKIDEYSVNNSSFALSNEVAFIEKSNMLKFLLQLKLILVSIKVNLAEMKLSEYSLGEIKFNLSKNNVFMDFLSSKSLDPGLPDNISLTLNKDSSLTIKQFFKKSNFDGRPLTAQFTIPDPRPGLEE